MYDSVSHLIFLLICGSEKTEKHFDKTDVEWSQWKMIEALHHVIIIKYYTSGTKFGLISKVI